MKKRNLLCYLPYGFVLLGLLIATFYDYPIDAYLYQPNNLFGLFFERFILIPLALSVPLCFFAFYRLYQEKRYYVCFVIACCYVLMDLLHVWIPLSQIGWFFIPLAIGFIVVLHVLCKQVAISYWKSKERFLWFWVAVFLSSLMITFTIKQLWGRVRYREMLDQIELFTPWFQSNGWNGHRSFPSGHTTTMSVILCVQYIYKEKEPARHVSLWTRIIIAFLILAMMLSRMIMGAHFLSDVLMGFAITYTMVQIWRRRFFYEGGEKR